MLYWDNAATTYPKPSAVTAAVATAFSKYGANPGRGGHALAYATSEMLYRCRETAAHFFGLAVPDNVAFTLNCTAALNMVIKGFLRDGGRAVISDVEHNAVLRPMFNVAGRRFDIAKVSFSDPAETVDNFRRLLRADTKLIVCTHASNVWGVTLPIREIGAVAREHGIPFAVDVAQSAGVLPIDMEKDNIDFLCVAGHKGLYGPMGTGMLLTSGRYPLPSFVEGGTGSRSLDPVQPVEWPDHMESGTPNTAGICGLKAGMEWVQSRGIVNIEQHELSLIQTVYRCLKKIPSARLYTPYPLYGKAVPVLSFNFDGSPSEQTAALLNEAGVAVRAGLHCAPLAHRKMGTEKQGTVRLSPSALTDPRECVNICKILQQTAQKTLHTN